MTHGGGWVGRGEGEKRGSSDRIESEARDRKRKNFKVPFLLVSAILLSTTLTRSVSRLERVRES